MAFNENTGEGVDITFTDDGKGIPGPNLDKIFDFGFTTTSGSGLGLYHNMEIVKKMGGKLIVDNKRTQGARFILTLK
jgi:signal transduction histidine kinase